MIHNPMIYCPKCGSQTVYVDPQVWHTTEGRVCRIACWNCGDDTYGELTGAGRFIPSRWEGTPGTKPFKVTARSA